MLHNTPSGRTGEQEPCGQERRAHNTTHRAGTPVNRNQVAKDTAHTVQRASTPVNTMVFPGSQGIQKYFAFFF